MENIVVSGSSTPKHGHAPWLVFHHDGKKDLTFFSLKDRKDCLRTFPKMQKNGYWPTTQGWMLILDAQLHRYFLLNPTTMAKIGLPPLKRKLLDYCDCILSSSPTNPECVVMCVDIHLQRLYYCKPGSKNWVWHKLEDWNLEDPNVVNISFVFSCNGKFYALTSRRYLAVIDFTPRLEIRTLERAIHEMPIGFQYGCPYFLESCGELFYVEYYGGRLQLGKATHFCVVKRNSSKRVWEVVDSIGDRVFFLGMNYFAASWSASDLGVKGDCIYFVRPDDKCMYVFDMEEGTVQVHLPCCNLRENWSTPFWIMPGI